MRKKLKGDERMKCFNHADAEAIATCLGCGKGLCRTCCQTSDSGGVVCSPACKEKTQAEEEALALIRNRAMKGTRVSGILCIVAGLIFGLFGLFHLTQPQFFLPIVVFTVALGIGLIVAGAMYLRINKDRR
jgi:hypothetical protein